MTLAPRVVVIHRPSELTELVARHGTRGQAEFFLRARGRDLAAVQHRHDELEVARQRVSASIPRDWRRGELTRGDLARFRFDAGDIVVAVGQDGLVANVAKYLDGQPVIGVDPLPQLHPGVLVPHRADDVARLLGLLACGQAALVQRTMVRATSDDGGELLALNEIYLGDPGHQSARYRVLLPDGREESQSSSGIIAGTGTGATGWCASIRRDRVGGLCGLPVPGPSEPRLAWFAREAWPSAVTGTSCTAGLLDGDEQLAVTVDSDRLVVFGDGIEADRLVVSWGQRVELSVADRVLHCVA